MRGANIPIAYQGVIYPSLKAACRAAGLDSGTVRYRCNKLQISMQEAFDLLVAEKDTDSYIPIVYQGIIYPLTQACKAAGITYNNVYYMKNKSNLSIQKAFDLVVERGVRSSKTPITYQGVKYPTLKAACEVAGLNRQTVGDKSRKLGITLQEAFDQLAVRGPRSVIEYKGITYTSMSEACRVAGITMGTMQARRDRLQISAQEAFDQLVSEGVAVVRIPITYKSLAYPSLSAACKAAGMNESTVRAKSHKLQISMQEAFDLLLVEGVKQNGISITYQGTVYTTLKDACEAAEINLTFVRDIRKKGNVSAQEAFDRAITVKNNPSVMCRSIASSLNDVTKVKHAYVSRSGTSYFTCTCKVCNRRILLSYDVAKNHHHAEEFCMDNEYKGRH